MNAYDLLDAVNGVDTDMIQKAETAGPKSGARRKTWRKIAVAAVCVTLAAVGGILWAGADRMHGKEPNSGITEPSAENAGPVQEQLLEILSSVTQSADVSQGLTMVDIPLGDRVAAYQGLTAPYASETFPAVKNQYTERLQAFAGPVVCEQESVKWRAVSEPESVKWHAVSGLDGYKYLILEQADGTLSLWEFVCFVTAAEAEIDDSEERKEEHRREWERIMEAAYPGAKFSSYTYGELFRTVYGVKSWEDIASITAAPSQANNTELGLAIQKQVGTKVFDDPETIRAFYDCVTQTVCTGRSSWVTYYRTVDPTRFSYSFSTDAADKLTSGESTWGDRWLTITLKNGTTIDRLKYKSLAGVLFEFNAIFSEPLSEEQVAVLNGIFGIR